MTGETLTEARRADRISARSRAITDAVLARQEADKAIDKAVAGLRRDGVSWPKIAKLLGVSKQAVMQKYGK